MKLEGWTGQLVTVNDESARLTEVSYTELEAGPAGQVVNVMSCHDPKAEMFA